MLFAAHRCKRHLPHNSHHAGVSRYPQHFVKLKVGEFKELAPIHRNQHLPQEYHYPHGKEHLTFAHLVQRPVSAEERACIEHIPELHKHKCSEELGQLV